MWMTDMTDMTDLSAVNTCVSLHVAGGEVVWADEWAVTIAVPPIPVVIERFGIDGAFQFVIERLVGDRDRARLLHAAQRRAGVRLRREQAILDEEDLIAAIEQPE